MTSMPGYSPMVTDNNMSRDPRYYRGRPIGDSERMLKDSTYSYQFSHSSSQTPVSAEDMTHGASYKDLFVSLQVSTLSYNCITPDRPQSSPLLTTPPTPHSLDSDIYNRQKTRQDTVLPYFPSDQKRSDQGARATRRTKPKDPYLKFILGERIPLRPTGPRELDRMPPKDRKTKTPQRSPQKQASSSKDAQQAQASPSRNPRRLERNPHGARSQPERERAHQATLTRTETPPLIGPRVPQFDPHQQLRSSPGMQLQGSDKRRPFVPTQLEHRSGNSPRGPRLAESDPFTLSGTSPGIRSRPVQSEAVASILAQPPDEDDITQYAPTDVGIIHGDNASDAAYSDRATAARRIVSDATANTTGGTAGSRSTSPESPDRGPVDQSRVVAQALESKERLERSGYTEGPGRARDQGAGARDTIRVTIRPKRSGANTQSAHGESASTTPQNHGRNRESREQSAQTSPRGQRRDVPAPTSAPNTPSRQGPRTDRAERRERQSLGTPRSQGPRAPRLMPDTSASPSVELASLRPIVSVPSVNTGTYQQRRTDGAPASYPDLNPTPHSESCCCSQCVVL